MGQIASLSILLIASLGAQAQTCPGDDEPELKVKTPAGITLALCGFEDHDADAPKGSRAFSDFKIYSSSEKQKEPQLVFESEPSELYAVRVQAKGFEILQLWYILEKPQPAMAQNLNCKVEKGCKLSAAKCVLKVKANVYPKALSVYQRKRSSKEEDGEEILDQILTQALGGDGAAQKFYGAPPADLQAAWREVFDSNQKKLQQARDLNCLRYK